MKLLKKTASVAKKINALVKSPKNAAKASPKAPTVRTLEQLAEHTPVGVVGILTQFVNGHKLDGAASWIGGRINEKYLSGLAKTGSSLSTAKRPTSKILVIKGQPRLIVWDLESLAGDTYTRIHPADKFVAKNTPVRGSISLLRKVYGTANVLLADESMVSRLSKSLKTDASCVRARE